MIQLIDLKEQYKKIQQEVELRVLDVLRNAQYIMGSEVKQFEEQIRNYLGVRHAITCGNGTDALVLALKACGVKEGHEVITTPYTFFATAEAISIVGASPVFVDVDLNSYNIDVTQIAEKITSRTKVIMPVHIFGQPANMQYICDLAKKNGIYVIEDACQAIGAECNGQKVGTFGDIACFSFFPTKNLGAFGDGGMLTTNNDELATVISALRIHGSGEYGRLALNLMSKDNKLSEIDVENNSSNYDKSKYYNYVIGCNSRLDEVQAAVLNVKIRYIDEWNEKRIETAEYYNSKLSKAGVVIPQKEKSIKHVYHMYILQTEYRDEIVKYLKEKGIATGIYYPIPLHLQKVYLNLGYKKGDFPNAEYLSDRTFAIPIYPELRDDQKQYIVKEILTYLNHRAK